MFDFLPSGVLVPEFFEEKLWNAYTTVKLVEEVQYTISGWF
jgi:hypothetical protein